MSGSTHMPRHGARLALGLLLVAVCATPAFAQKSWIVGSHSMEPTLPWHGVVILDLVTYLAKDPRRGEVVVYRTPDNKSFYTHRVVGLPGDSIEYGLDKRLKINGAVAPMVAASAVLRLREKERAAQVFEEALPDARHLVLLDPALPAIPPDFPPASMAEACQRRSDGLRCIVPNGKYFVLGDNRDWSQDSRYLGFIDRASIGGRVLDVPDPR